MHITLEEAKAYLRVDTSDEDELITRLIQSAEAQVQDIASFSDDEWQTMEEKILIRMRTAVLYAVGYLFEHREEADHHTLNLTLRDLLFGTRKEGF